jgi:hypothetical protein
VSVSARLWLIAALLGAWPGVAHADETLWEALRAPGSVVVLRHSDLTGLDVRMGTVVVLRRGADGMPAVAGQMYVE